MATKAELIAAVADRADTDKKTAEAVLGAFFDHTAEQVKAGEKVAWPGFGSFSTRRMSGGCRACGSPAISRAGPIAFTWTPTTG